MYNDKKKTTFKSYEQRFNEAHNYHFHFQNAALNVGAVLSDSIVTAHKV